MENTVYLLVAFLLGAIWFYIYTRMITKLNEAPESYGEMYTIYKDTEEHSFLVRSIDYDEAFGDYHINFCYAPEDDFIRLSKYEALALVMSLNCYQDDEEELFKLKKL